MKKMKKLFSVMGNHQKLDGGAMFGNVPKALWSTWCKSDENNRILLACRALLIEDNGKFILCETGIGAFFEPKLKDRFGVMEPEHILLMSLKKLNLSHEDISTVILSHLHFDHAGGLLSAWDEHKTPQLLFPNARYLIGKEAWERAKNPHPRDQASFIPLLNNLLEESGRLEIIDSEYSSSLGKDYRFRFTNGHTPGMMHTEVTVEDGNVLFAADLIPGTPWVHLPVTMGYDRAPEQLINEKKEFLDYVVKNNAKIFYTHDAETAMSRIVKDEKGRFRAVDLEKE